MIKPRGALGKTASGAAVGMERAGIIRKDGRLRIRLAKVPKVCKVEKGGPVGIKRSKLTGRSRSVHESRPWRWRMRLEGGMGVGGLLQFFVGERVQVGRR